MLFARLSTSVFFTTSAFAAAIADPFPFPEALSYAGALPEGEICSTTECHNVCGPMILAARACTENGDDAGPWDTDCLCSADSSFMENYESCMSCGLSIWSIYGRFLSGPLAACPDTVREPTGSVEVCVSTSSSTSSSDDPVSSVASPSGQVSSDISSSSEDPISSSDAPISSQEPTSSSDASASSGKPTYSSDPVPSSSTSSDGLTSSDGSTSSDVSTSSDKSSLGSSSGTTSSPKKSTTTSEPVYGNSTSTVTANGQSTTVITITSCEENKCSEVPVTTGVTVITETRNGVATEYTTWCPISSEEKPTATTAITKTGNTAVESTTTAKVTSIATISTFEGKAGSFMVGTTFVGAIFGLLFL